MDQNAHQRCLDLVNSTGYQIIQSNGQRVYQLPNETAKVAKGSEIFVGKLPRDLFEDEIVPIFSKIGRLHQVRLMMDFDGNNRGFCFITYYQASHAESAITVLNGFEIRPNKRIGVHKSINNCRLFIGGIPVDKTSAEVCKCFNDYVDGIVDIIMYPSRDDRKLNRGYAFLEFETHREAAMARRNLSPGRFLMWNVSLLVDWAEPIPEVDEDIMAKVKKLYFRNLDVSLTATDLCNFLTKFVPVCSITKIHKTGDYAFVHFTHRCIAQYCLDTVKGALSNNLEIEVTWARPRIYSKLYREYLPTGRHLCKSLPPTWTKATSRKSSDSANSSSTSVEVYSSNTWSNVNMPIFF